jgi:phospholipid transport system substrate-binding protein
MRCVLALAALLVLAPVLAPRARAAEPTEQLRTEIGQVYKILQTPNPTPAAQREAVAILDGMFDWRQMSESALRRHWAQRTPEEQEQFIRLFSELFRRAYLSRIHVIDASKFQYLGDSVRGNEGTVKMKVFTSRGSGINVDYAVYQDDRQRWRVRDVRVEQISLVENYRTQFDSIITKSSYAELIKRLEASRNRSAPEAARSAETGR